MCTNWLDDLDRDVRLTIASTRYHGPTMEMVLMVVAFDLRKSTQFGTNLHGFAAGFIDIPRDGGLGLFGGAMKVERSTCSAITIARSAAA